MKTKKRFRQSMRSPSIVPDELEGSKEWRIYPETARNRKEMRGWK